jgi:tight adherence protein C
MSDLWLVFALVGTFLTIFLVGVVIDMVLRERRRPVTILESQVGQVTDSVDLRQQELEGNVFDRAVMPTAKKVGRGLTRLTPVDLHPRINRKLVLAGNPAGWDAERVVALKIVFAVVGLVGGLLLVALLPIDSWIFKAVFVGILTFLGYQIPSLQVSSMAARRQKTIQRQLADVMDLLTISVEAGLGFDAALAQVVKNVPGPLAEELSRLLQEVQIGVSRADAFRNLGERTDVPELQAFVLSMIQADLFGVSIANVLRAQSRELRQKRRQRAEELAQKVPVKLLFPMIFLVMPAMFVVLIGPGIIKIYDQFFG